MKIDPTFPMVLFTSQVADGDSVDSLQTWILAVHPQESFACLDDSVLVVIADRHQAWSPRAELCSASLAVADFDDSYLENALKVCSFFSGWCAEHTTSAAFRCRHDHCRQNQLNPVDRWQESFAFHLDENRMPSPVHRNDRISPCEHGASIADSGSKFTGKMYRSAVLDYYNASCLNFRHF